MSGSISIILSDFLLTPGLLLRIMQVGSSGDCRYNIVITLGTRQQNLVRNQMDQHDPIQLGILVVSIIAVAFSILSAVVAIVWAVAKINIQTAKISSEIHGMADSIQGLNRTLSTIETRQENQEIRLTVLEKTAYSTNGRSTIKSHPHDVEKS